MKVVGLGKVPEGCGSRHYDYEELNEFCLERAENGGAQEIYYWYGIGNWEGNGQALVKNSTQWMVVDLSHCSCYGPFDEFEFGIGGRIFESLKDISEDVKDNEDLKKNIEPLIGLAGGTNLEHVILTIKMPKMTNIKHKQFLKVLKEWDVEVM